MSFWNVTVIQKYKKRVQVQIFFRLHYYFMVNTVKGCHESDPKEPTMRLLPILTGVLLYFAKENEETADVCISEAYIP